MYYLIAPFAIFLPHIVLFVQVEFIANPLSKDRRTQVTIITGRGFDS